MKQLLDIAYARSGDKGSSANIGVISYKKEDYPFLLALLTEEKIFSYFAPLSPKKVTRYLLPNLWAINFVLEGVLDGGGSVSLRLDNQGKTLAQALLLMKIPSMEKKT